MLAFTASERYLRYGFYVLLVFIIGLCCFLVSPFLNAILGSAVIAVLTYPLYSSLRKRFSDSVSALITVLTSFVCVAIPIGLIASLVFLQFSTVAADFKNAESQTKQAISIESVANQLDDQFAPQLKQFGIKLSAAEYVADENNRKQLVERVTGPITRTATSTLVGAVLGIIAFLTLFFMLRDGHKLRAPAIELLPLPEDRSMRLLERIQATIHAVFMGVIIVALIQGIMATITYAIVGVEPWLLWGFVTMILCAIPLLGAPVVYVPWALILLSQGKYWQAITLLVVGFVLISNIDNILRPKYIGDRVGLHYIGIFFSLLGGVLAFGPVGLMVGPVLLATSLELIAYIRDEMKPGGLVPPLESKNPSNSG